jgi:outer membrane protein assembly factor BamB
MHTLLKIIECISPGFLALRLPARCLLKHDDCMLSIFNRIGCLALVCISPGMLEAAKDWPQFMGPYRNGSNNEQQLTTNWQLHAPKKSWSKQVGSGFSGPIILDSKVFLFHRIENQDHLDCFSLASGERLWRTSYPTRYRDRFGFDDGPRATPAADQERIYLMSATGTIRAISLQQGEELWTLPAEDKWEMDQGFFGKAPSPIILDQSVIFILGAKPNAGVVALNKEDGVVLWSTLSEDADYASPVIQAGVDHPWLWVWMRDHLHRLDPTLGKITQSIRWRSSMNAAVNAASPLVIPEGLFVSASYGTGAVLLKEHGAKWEPQWSGDNQMSNHYAHCVYQDGFLFGFHGRQEHGPELRCIQANTGTIKWQVADLGAGSLILADGYLLVLLESGELVLAEAQSESWKVLGRKQILPSGVRAFPALADGRLVARSPEQMVAYDLRKTNP